MNNIVCYNSIYHPSFQLCGIYKKIKKHSEKVSGSQKYNIPLWTESGLKQIQCNVIMSLPQICIRLKCVNVLNFSPPYVQTRDLQL